MESVPAKAAGKPSRPLSQNRRRGNRHRLDIPATLLFEGDHALEVPIVVTGISVGGIGFRCPRALTISATVKISSFDTLIPHGLRACIVTVRELPTGEFEIGATTI